jgi:arylsulfatase
MRALQMIRDQKASNPSKPWFMWFCPGANHAPHHAPQEYIDKYKGKFDDGYEAYREWVLPRMIEQGHPAEGTELTPLNPLPRTWQSPADCVRPGTRSTPTRRSSSRAWPRSTRVLRVHRRAGRPDRRLPRAERPARQHVVFYCADNGASGEGSPNGSVNENKFFNGYPTSCREHEVHRQSRERRHLRTLPDRLGDGHLGAVQDVQALRRVCRRHV